jgi:enediyne biosynthesis protein E4
LPNNDSVMKRTLFLLISLSLYWIVSLNTLQAEVCRDLFVPRRLLHRTSTPQQPVSFYEGNGSGVGIHDLNNDGKLDVVLGNLAGANTILWNQGGLQFRAEPFGLGRTRAVSLVDVEGDGWVDIVLTTQTGAPSLWHNNGDMTFSAGLINGVMHPAYTLDWGDVDSDGDLDLVTASYDAELTKLLQNAFLFGEGAGVYYYENQEGYFVPTRLADTAQALAIRVGDVDGNGAVDVLIGNDFSMPDQGWTFSGAAWVPFMPFGTTTFNTMSFDAGDINNDGVDEFFAADMLPPTRDTITRWAWARVLDSIKRAARLPGDVQVAENVLHMMDTEGTFRNQAAAMGVAATGWTWSARFGDLDADGFLDLYAVNGMESVELFSHLPGSRLVEPNAAFRNQGGEQFVPMPGWGLGSRESGRGMSMADLDNDGDLDIVVNNLNAEAALYENQVCGGSSLQVALHWAGAQNVAGIGARLTLVTSAGVYTREMRAGSGYLSGDAARVHFGFPQGTTLERLEVQWSDGYTSVVEPVPSDSWVTIRRS